jgi:hypothetical protein
MACERCGNADAMIPQARSRETSASEPLQKHRKLLDDVTSWVTVLPGSRRGKVVTVARLSTLRCVRGEAAVVV